MLATPYIACLTDALPVTLEELDITKETNCCSLCDGYEAHDYI